MQGSTYISDICKLRHKYPIWQLEGVTVSAAVGEVDLLGGDDEVPPDGGEVDGDAGEAAGVLTLTASHACLRSSRSLLQESCWFVSFIDSDTKNFAQQESLANKYF